MRFTATWLAAGLALLWGCSADGASEGTASVRSALIGGQPSGPEDDAAIYIERAGEDGTILRCSGRIIAPGLALAARHCIVKRKSTGVLCNPDGSPRDISDTTDLSVEPAEHVTVFIGSTRSALRRVGVREILTTEEVSICKADIAFLVLAEPGIDVRTPLARDPVRIGEELRVAGWGYTSDHQADLPEQRSSLAGLVVQEVGPGLIPPGTFAIGGNSMCFGDSGSVALSQGTAVGVYSRIDGDGVCELSQTRNIFTSVAAHGDLAARAYAAIGETPWYAGDRPPWLGSPQVSCQDCVSETADKPYAPAPAQSSSCAMAPPSSRASCFYVMAVLALLSGRRRRRHPLA